MLTNLFYFDYYRPYIFGNEKICAKYGTTKESHKRERTEKNEKSDLKSEDFESISDAESEYSIFLNKAFKSEIVTYAGNISKDFNSIKNSAKDIFYNMSGNYYDFENKKEKSADSIERFVNQYNSYQNFAEKNTKHSISLSSFAESLKYRVDMNSDELLAIGVGFEDNKLSFDRDILENMNSSDFEEARDGVKQFCNSVYKDTCEVMTMPMVEHMNFKNLDYYYNYKYSSNKHSNTVKIIESGMLVDICL